MRAAGREVEIVQASPGNVEALLSLITELAEFEGLEPPTEEARERLRLHITVSPAPFHAFIAYSDGRAVGYITYYFTYSTFLAEPTLFLEDIYVREKERMQGIGGKLFRHCVREAIAKGCGRMEWCALNWNVDAMAFYERQGARRMDWTFFRLDRKAMERLEAKEGAARLV